MPLQTAPAFMTVVRRLVRPVPLAALALALCLCGLLALHLWRGHAKAEADARLITSTLGQAIEQHVAGQMRGIATLLDEVAAMVSEQSHGPPDLAGYLGERLAVFPEITGLVLMHGNGDWVDLGNDEHLAPSQAQWLHDRLPGGAGLVIGPPHVQAGDGHRVQVVAWLFTHEGGTAAIATKLDVNSLSAFLQTVLVPETAMLAVVHRSSAKVVAAVPEPDGGFARDFPRPDAAIGTVLPVEGLDLDVWVMADQGSAFALWQSNAALGGLLLILLCAAILFWARRGDAAWCHLVQTRDGLEDLVVSRGEELRQTRVGLEQKVRQVSAANREMQRLSMVTAHHLQEPLRPLVSYSQILLRRLPTERHDARARLERLIQGGKDMKVLLRGFQQRVAALGIDAPTATVELRQVVQRAMVDAGIGIPIRLGTLPALDVASDGIPEVLVQVLRTLEGWRAATIDVEAQLQDRGWVLRISGSGGDETAVAVRICQSLAGLNGFDLSYGQGCFILALPSPAPSVVDAPPPAPPPLPRQFTARIQALALIAALLMAMGWQMLRERDSAIHAAQVLTLAVANSIDQQISGSLRGIDTVLAEAAAMITRGEYLNRTFSVRMEGILRAYPEIRHISLADATGKMSTAVWPPRLVPGGTIDVSDRTYFQAARANARERSQMVVGDPVLGRINNERSLHVARPLVGDKGDFAGIVYASLDPDIYARFLDRVLLDRDGGTALIGANGRMIARAPAHVEKFGIDISSSDLFTRWLPQAPMGTAHLISKADGNDKYLAYRLLSPYPLVVTSAVSRNRALAQWQSGLTGAVTVGALLSVTLFLLAWTADRGMARIRRRQGALAAEVARRTQGLEAARALSDSRAASLDRLNEQLRDLLGVVTRDLQAPLVALQDEAGRLAADLTADNRGKPEELDYVLAAIARLSALLRDFQRFVAITSMSANPQKVDLGGLVRLAVDDMERRFGPAVLLVEAEVLPVVCVDGGLMLELLSQIFTNAVTYRRRSQAAFVWIRAQNTTDGWRLDIADDGPGFPPEQLSHDPQMFDTGIGQAADSTGIGLAICRVIAQAHGGELWLSNGTQGGAVVSISLPEN